jgi:hypothetical protein
MTCIRVNEGAEKAITVPLVGPDGVSVSFADLTAATVTLYDLDTYVPTSPTDGIINSRVDQDILSSSPAELTEADGGATFVLQPDDNIIVTERRQIERHRAIFAFETDTAQFNYECEIEVVNLRGAA